MKFGIRYCNTGRFVDPQRAVELVQAAEEAGFESAWTVEHTVVPEGHASAYPYSQDGRMAGDVYDFPIPDPLIWMSYVAAATSKIRRRRVRRPCRAGAGKAAKTASTAGSSKGGSAFVISRTTVVARPASFPQAHAGTCCLVGFDEDHAGGFQGADDIRQGSVVGLPCASLEINEGLLRNAGRCRKVGLAHVQQRPCGFALLPRDQFFIRRPIF